jgi:hypothetical protein
MAALFQNKTKRFFCQRRNDFIPDNTGGACDKSEKNEES